MRYMEILLILFALTCMIFAAGCSKQVDEQGNVVTTQKTVTGDTKTTIETKDGQTVTITGSGGSGWCAPGSDWKMNSVGGEQDVQAKWKIIKLETSGKYSGMCHVLYTLSMDNGQSVTMDYWFAEDGKSGYYEMTTPEGQKITQSWSG